MTVLMTLKLNHGNGPSKHCSRVLAFKCPLKQSMLKTYTPPATIGPQTREMELAAMLSVNLPLIFAGG